LKNKKGINTILRSFFRNCKTLKNRYKPITQFIVNEEGELLSNSGNKAEKF